MKFETLHKFSCHESITGIHIAYKWYNLYSSRFKTSKLPFQSTNNHCANSLVGQKLHQNTMAGAAINNVGGLDTLGQAADATVHLHK